MSGGFNPISMISQAALAAATGGTSLIAQLAMQVVSQVVQQVIAQVGQQMGLSNTAIGMAQDAFAGAMGGAGGFASAATNQGSSSIASLLSQIGQHTNASASQMGHIQKQVDQMQSAVQNLIQQQAQKAGQTSTDGEGNTTTAKSKATAASSGSWLMAIAEVIGNKLNKAADQMKSDANALDWKDAKQATNFQAETQDFQMLFTTLSNVIKTIGEAEKGMASKQ